MFRIVIGNLDKPSAFGQKAGPFCLCSRRSHTTRWHMTSNSGPENRSVWKFETRSLDAYFLTQHSQLSTVPRGGIRMETNGISGAECWTHCRAGRKGSVRKRRERRAKLTLYNGWHAAGLICNCCRTLQEPGCCCCWCRGHLSPRKNHIPRFVGKERVSESSFIFIGLDIYGTFSLFACVCMGGELAVAHRQAFFD